MTEAHLIVVYAGIQADEPDRESPRLPREREEELADRVRGLLDSLEPRIVTGALASGSDLIIAEAALHARRHLDVHLPYDADNFVATSVAPRGQRWVDRFHTTLKEAATTHVAGEFRIPDRECFLAHNIALLDHAAALSRPDERVWALTIRPPEDPDSPSVSDHFARHATARGLLSLDLNPIANRRRAFIAMAYGKKPNPPNLKEYDCDPAFHRVYRPLLEDFDIDWTRADLQADTGLIHVGMLDDLAHSDIVIADLSTSNFNVGYELGLRHAFAPFATVLVRPTLRGAKDSTVPFDVKISRNHRFEIDQQISDEDAEAAIEKLRPVIRSVLQVDRRDSPVHDWFAVGDQRPLQRRGELPEAVKQEFELRRAIALAIRSSDAGRMRSAARELQACTEIGEETRQALRIELAAGLLDEAAYQASADLLDASEPAEHSPMHRTWLHKSAMAHRRLGDESAPGSAVRDQHWQLAEDLLSTALRLEYQDSETYGIYGGLLKNRFKATADTMSTAAANALFDVMCEQYQLGFEIDPSYYLGVNLVMALRIRMRRSPEARAAIEPGFHEALTVSKFLTRIAMAAERHSFWPAVTHAELLLHTALFTGGDTAPAIEAYARAARLARPEYRNSAINQLDFLQLCGDPPQLLTEIRAVLDTAGGQRANRSTQP